METRKLLVAMRQVCNKEPMYMQRLFMIACFCCLALVAGAQQVSPDVEKLLDLEKKWTDAYKDRNIGIMRSLLAEDFTITVEDGRIFGKIGYISHTTDSSVQVEVAEQSELKVRLHGVVAVVTGGYHETGTAKNKRYEYHDRFTDVWMKVNGQWELIASQYAVPSQQ